MTLSFDPQDTTIEMLRKVSDAKILEFFDYLGLEEIVDRVDFFNEDEGLLFDCEG